MNETHYSEADLLETYYTQPGASMPVMMHLAGCSDCAARYDRLDAKLRGLSQCHTDPTHTQPDTFWARQRIAIMKKVSARRGERPSRMFGVAAAATLALVLTTVMAIRTDPVAPLPPDARAMTAEAPVTASSDDPWQSEELKEFEPIVAWESWVDSAETRETGDQS
jgi:hypothetical protein